MIDFKYEISSEKGVVNLKLTYDNLEFARAIFEHAKYRLAKFERAQELESPLYIQVL